jgi:ComF family protein
MNTGFAQRIESLRTILLDVLFPRRCLGCDASHTTLCDGCLSHVELPVPNLPAHVHALYSYKNPLIKKAVWKLKYSRTHDIARVFGIRLSEMIIGDFGEDGLPLSNPIYLIPIPISSKRMRERGYNQAKLLTDAMLLRDTSGILRNGSMFLKRHDSHIRQSHTKGKQERLQNIVGSFYAPKNLESNAHYILIDDVVTTGATLREAKRALMAAGTRKVSAYAIAH